MERPLDALERDLEALRAAWADSMPAFGAIAGAAQAEVEQMSDAGLMHVTDLLAQVRRDADALLTRVAAEVAKRSGREFGDTGLAKAQGFHSPVRLIAASTGASRSDAAKLIAVGGAIAERQTFGGERLPSRHPHVATALGSAEISLEAASAITSMLDRVAVRADPDLADRTEDALVELASQVPLGCSSAEFARPRRGSITTASNRGKSSFAMSARSPCAMTVTAWSTCTPASTPRTRRR